MLKRTQAKLKIVALLIFIVGIIADIFFVSGIFDWLVVFLALLWIVILITYKFLPVHNLVLGTFCLVISFIFQYSQNPIITEKGASWFFIFLFLTFGHKTVQNVFKTNER